MAGRQQHGSLRLLQTAVRLADLCQFQWKDEYPGNNHSNLQRNFETLPDQVWLLCCFYALKTASTPLLRPSFHPITFTRLHTGLHLRATQFFVAASSNRLQSFFKNSLYSFKLAGIRQLPSDSVYAPRTILALFCILSIIQRTPENQFYHLHFCLQRQ